MPSFHKALELGADGFELDVRLTGDGQLIVVHGSVINDHAVQNSPYTDVRKIQDGYEIPLLEDVLIAFGRRTYIDIELKTPGIEEAALALIEKHCDLSRMLISSFHAQTLVKVRQLAPDLQLGFI